MKYLSLIGRSEKFKMHNPLAPVIKLIFLLMYSVANLYGQEVKTTNILVPTFIGARYMHEYPVSEKHVLIGSFGIYSSFSEADVTFISQPSTINSRLFGDALQLPSSGEFALAVVPRLSIEIRKYYNLEKRDAKAKKIRDNAGSFFSFEAYYTPKTDIRNVKADLPSVIRLGPKWGFRKATFKSSVLELSLGSGLGKTGGFKPSFALWIDFIWAWTLNKN